MCVDVCMTVFFLPWGQLNLGHFSTKTASSPVQTVTITQTLHQHSWWSGWEVDMSVKTPKFSLSSQQESMRGLLGLTNAD